MNAVEKLQDKKDLPDSVTPPLLVERAFATGNMELVEKAMALQERWESTRARKAFDAAVSAVKGKIPPIVKNRTGHNNKKYADLAAICETIDPILEEHGLGYRFRAKQDDKTIHVTCVLFHRDGHREENSLAGPADNSGNKNAIQSIGSTLTYLQRYSLTQALGLSAAEDDDAHSAGHANDPPITMEQAEKLRARLDQLKIKTDYFYQVMGINNVSELTDKTYAVAMRKLDLNEAKQKEAAGQK